MACVEWFGDVIDFFSYGKQKVVENTSADMVTQSFTGKELDLYVGDEVKGEDGEGRYYFGARYYDAEVGIWTSTGPVHGNDWSPFVYCHNNPNLNQQQIETA